MRQVGGCEVRAGRLPQQLWKSLSGWGPSLSKGVAGGRALGTPVLPLSPRGRLREFGQAGGCRGAGGVGGSSWEAPG